MADYNFGDGKTSKYHGAFLYVERIDHILRELTDINIYREKITNIQDKREVIEKNYSLLKVFLTEIIGRIEEKKRKEILEQEKKVTVVYKQFIIMCNKHMKPNLDFLELFDVHERNLRIIADEKGLIMPDKDRDTGL